MNYEKATHSLAEQIDDKESVSLIRKAMDALPEAQKMAVQLRDIEGLDYSQIEEKNYPRLLTVCTDDQIRCCPSWCS